MPYKHFSLSFKSPLDTSFWKDRFYRADIDALYSEIEQASSLDYLLNFAHNNTWRSVNIDDILSDQLRGNSKNICLDKVIVKSSNLNLIFEQARNVLPGDGYFAFRYITAENAKLKIQEDLDPILFKIYYPLYFLVRRVLPKLKGFRKLCRWLSVPVDKSKAEIVGRLIYKGFTIISLRELYGQTLIVARVNLKSNPSEIKPTPCEGFVFKMNRIGKAGKKIIVYKLRTMHPYAEYAQDYIYRSNGLDIGGKYKNDFRISVSGRLLRKYWIDEIPMIVNLLKGDIKLIGVRPISEYYFNLYPADVQVIRRNHKPGLLPPFYADLPGTFEEIVQSELNYLNKYEESPFKTDLSYLVKIVKNILIHKARSK